MLKHKELSVQTANRKLGRRALRKGFTMAEILIAMTIIGIIAAITLPQLLGDTSGRTNKLLIQKSYALLSQTLKISQGKLDYNTSDIDRIVNKTGSGAPDADSQLSLENILTKTLDMTKLEDTTTHAFSGKILTLGATTSGSATLSRASSETSTGITVNNSGAGDKRGAIFESRDGAYYIFPDKTDIDSYSCTKKSPCLAYIDINGKEAPNMLVGCLPDSNTGYWYWDTANKKVKYMKNSTTEASGCTTNDMQIGDVYPVLIYGATVVPALNAADTILKSHE